MHAPYRPNRAFDGEEHMTAKKAVVRRAVKAVDRAGSTSEPSNAFTAVLWPC
jgi:hypothetical protein